MGSAVPAVEAVGLCREFGSVRAVDHLSLAVAKGEIYGFLGPNGAGKSTVVRMLCTLLRPTSGQARVAGYDVVGQAGDVRLRIGVALQDASLDEKQTGRELLRLQGRLYGLRRSEVDRRMNEVLSLVDIGDAIDRRVKTYSGGMKRRLDLAASLIHNPDVLFLDEPTTGLDPASRISVLDEVRRLNRELGMTIFLTTQYLEEADELAERVGILAHGRLVAEGTPEELKRSIADDVVVADVEGDDRLAIDDVVRIPGVRAVTREGDRLTIRTDDGPATIGAIAVALESRGLRTQSLTLRQPTLDDVFLQLTGAHIEPDIDVQ